MGNKHKVANVGFARLLLIPSGGQMLVIIEVASGQFNLKRSSGFIRELIGAHREA
jgi:hypothetical protein